MSQDASSQELLAQLNQGIRDLQVDISAAQAELLMDYLIEFQRWNRTHNLSAIHDLKESVVLHLLDSLAVLPYLDRYVAALPDSSGVFSLADLGTGGGLPGIPLAICRPTWQIHLMEAVQKLSLIHI